MKNRWYKVTEVDNVYDDMTGKLVEESPRAMVLEFQMSEKLGDVHKVQFWKRSLFFVGEY